VLIKIILLCRTVDVSYAATTASPPGTLCYHNNVKKTKVHKIHRRRSNSKNSPLC